MPQHEPWIGLLGCDLQPAFAPDLQRIDHAGEIGAGVRSVGMCHHRLDDDATPLQLLQALDQR